jgi:cytochrome c oxidase subunit 2
MQEFLARWMPLDASAHGARLDYWNAMIHWLMAILFVGWAIYFVYVLFRFSARRNPTASYAGSQSHVSTWIEIGVAGIEVILLVGFAIPAWADWVEPHAPSEDALVVRVIGEQFAWNVHYPGADGVFGRAAPDLVDTATNPLGLDRSDPLAVDDVVTINQLHLPVNRPVTVRLSSKDVIHSFGLPVMRVKQDAIPGLEIPIHFTPVLEMGEGERWEIACAQLCGLGHYRMRGFLTVESEAEFEAWLAERAPKPAAPAPSPAAAEEPVEVGGEGAAGAEEHAVEEHAGAH